MVLKKKLMEIDWNIEADTVQDFWNFFENRLTGIIDEIVPFKAQITETITYMIMLYSRFSQSANKLSSCSYAWIFELCYSFFACFGTTMKNYLFKMKLNFVL